MDGEDKNSCFSLVFSPRRCCYDNVAQELRRKNYVHDSLTAVMSQPFGHVEYDMKKYDWEGIADEVGAVYD